MILIKNGTFYSVKNQTEQFKLEGRVFFDNQELKLDLVINNNDGAQIGTATYIYKNGGICSKSIADIQRTNISQVEQVLEETLSFILQRFDIDQN